MRRTATVTRSEARTFVDIAIAQAPSASLPLGSVYLASIIADKDQDRPTIFEWDVSGERILRRTQLPKKGDASSSSIRLTVSGDRVFAVSEAVGPGKAQLTVMNRKLEAISETTVDAWAGISLEATDKYVVLASTRLDLEERPLSITVLDARELRPIGNKAINAATGHAGGGMGRVDALEIVGDRLYAVALSEPGKPRRNATSGNIVGTSSIFAFDLPSLSPHQTFATNVAASSDARLMGKGKNIVFAGGESYIELTPELRAVRTHSITDIDGTIGTDGWTFGFDARPSTQIRERFPRVGFTCTSAWSSSEPLYACNAGDAGVIVARFGAARP